MRSAAVVALCLIALAGCHRNEQREGAAPAAAPAPIGFQHEPGFDAQGYYRPVAAVAAGQYRLTSIAVGAPSDFEAWENGKREEVFGPIVFEFEDQSSPMEDTEAGQHHAVRMSVRPVAYRMGPGRFAFHGKDDKLGEVDFDGSFDTAALATAKAAGGSEGRGVLTGAVSIGNQRFAGVKLGYWAGD